jgi:anthranilate phosphoribosyltransferase
MNVLEGKGTVAQNSVVIANAAMALYCADRKQGLLTATSRAQEALKSGNALRSFTRLMNG